MNNTDCDLCWFQSLGIRATAQQNSNVLCHYLMWRFNSSPATTTVATPTHCLIRILFEAAVLEDEEEQAGQV